MEKAGNRPILRQIRVGKHCFSNPVAEVAPWSEGTSSGDPRMSTPRLAIFDLDGTLLDSLEDLANSANAMLVEAGFRPHDLGSYRHFVGNGARNLVERILPETAREPEIIDRCLCRYLSIYGERWDEKSRSYDGIPELLDGLQARQVELAVLSNKSQEATNRCIERFFGGWPWLRVIGQREGHPRKPDPAGVFEILGAAGLKAGDAVYVGDTDTDMQTAVAAGVLPVGVLWGFRDREELEKNGARKIIGKPVDLLGILDLA
jgi:phosphoglycolate phosphatase